MADNAASAVDQLADHLQVFRDIVVAARASSAWALSARCARQRLAQLMADAGRHLPQVASLPACTAASRVSAESPGALQRSNLPGQVGGALGDAVFQLGVHPAQFFTAVLAVAQVGGIRRTTTVLPVLKRETHRQALLKAATSGSAKFFWHRQRPARPPHQRSPVGCAGMYTAHAALELYAEAFDSVGALDQLEARQL